RPVLERPEADVVPTGPGTAVGLVGRLTVQRVVARLTVDTEPEGRTARRERALRRCRRRSVDVREERLAVGTVRDEDRVGARGALCEPVDGRSGALRVKGVELADRDRFGGVRALPVRREHLVADRGDET